jgi:hypothetical protein
VISAATVMRHCANADKEPAMQEDRAEIRRQLGCGLIAAQRQYDRQMPEDFAPKAERNVEVERELTAGQDRDAVRVSSLAEVDAAKAANPGRVVIVCSGKVLNHRAEAD